MIFSTNIFVRMAETKNMFIEWTQQNKYSRYYRLYYFIKRINIFEKLMDWDMLAIHMCFYYYLKVDYHNVSINTSWADYDVQIDWRNQLLRLVMLNCIERSWATFKSYSLNKYVNKWPTHNITIVYDHTMFLYTNVLTCAPVRSRFSALPSTVAAETTVSRSRLAGRTCDSENSSERGHRARACPLRSNDHILTDQRSIDTRWVYKRPRGQPMGLVELWAAPRFYIKKRIQLQRLVALWQRFEPVQCASLCPC